MKFTTRRQARSCAKELGVPQSLVVRSDGGWIVSSPDDLAEYIFTVGKSYRLVDASGMSSDTKQPVIGKIQAKQISELNGSVVKIKTITDKGAVFEKDNPAISFNVLSQYQIKFFELVAEPLKTEDPEVDLSVDSVQPSVSEDSDYEFEVGATYKLTNVRDFIGTYINARLVKYCQENYLPLTFKITGTKSEDGRRRYLIDLLFSEIDAVGSNSNVFFFDTERKYFTKVVEENDSEQTKKETILQLAMKCRDIDEKVAALIKQKSSIIEEIIEAVKK